jgi:hypothetical protein
VTAATYSPACRTEQGGKTSTSKLAITMALFC